MYLQTENLNNKFERNKNISVKSEDLPKNWLL